MKIKHVRCYDMEHKCQVFIVWAEGRKDHTTMFKVDSDASKKEIKQTLKVVGHFLKKDLVL